MRTTVRLAHAALVSCGLVLAATSANAETPCERRALVEKNLQYIDRISPYCRGLTTAASLALASYAPYPIIVNQLGGGIAGLFVRAAAAYGLNFKTMEFDKHHTCRLLRTANKMLPQTSGNFQSRLAQYGLCRPEDEACKKRVRSLIYKEFKLPKACKTIA